MDERFYSLYQILINCIAGVNESTLRPVKPLLNDENYAGMF